MPLSPSSDWILVYLFALSSFIFFLFCHFFVQIHRIIEISAPFMPAVKEAIESVSEMDLPHSTSSISSSDSSDFKQSEEARVSNGDADGDLTVSGALIHIESRDSETNGLIRKIKQEIVDPVLDSDVIGSCGVIMDGDVVSVCVEDSFPITDSRNDSNLGVVEQEQEEDDQIVEVQKTRVLSSSGNANATSVKFSQVEVVEEELLKISDGDFEPVISDLKEFVEESSSSSVDHESKAITEDCDKETSVFNESSGVLPPEEPESSGIMEDYDLQKSVCSNSSGVLPPAEPEFKGIMEDYYYPKTSVYGNSGDVLPPAEPESIGVMEDYFIQTSVSSCVLQPAESESKAKIEDYDIQTPVCRDSVGVHPNSEPESGGIMEDHAELHPDSPSMASDLKYINELLPDSQSMSIASDLEKFTELYDDPPSMNSDMKNFTELHHDPPMASYLENFTELGHDPPSMVSDLKILTEFHPDPPYVPSDLENCTELHGDHLSTASDLKKFTELHPDPPSMDYDPENFTELHPDPSSIVKQKPIQPLNGNENSKDRFKPSVAEEVDEHNMVEIEEKTQHNLNYIEISQLGQEEIMVSREEQSHVSVEGDEDERIDDKDIQISHPTKYKPIFSVPSYSLKRTSWRSCCGLFDVLRSYK